MKIQWRNILKEYTYVYKWELRGSKKSKKKIKSKYWFSIFALPLGNELFFHKLIWPGYNKLQIIK